MVHGDIKPENVLVNSYNWLLLSDIATAKPVYCMDDNLEAYNMFFGYLDNNERCYLAPERWRSPPTNISTENAGAELHKPMDIFSLGCVIAEILMDEPLFNLVKLNGFRKDQFDVKKCMEETGKIEPQIIDLIEKMIRKDPAKRPTIEQCIRDWIASRAIPRSFSQVFF